MSFTFRDKKSNRVGILLELGRPRMGSEIVQLNVGGKIFEASEPPAVLEELPSG